MNELLCDINNTELLNLTGSSRMKGKMSLEQLLDNAEMDGTLGTVFDNK